MAEAARTKVDRDLEARAEAVANDPERARVIDRTRRFKSSWIELAESLVEVRRESRWQTWGHDSFDTYTRVELSLRQETVEKLTGSYLFLKNKAPTVLERDGVREKIPTYQAVDFLRRAEEQESAPREVVEELRSRVIDDAAAHGPLHKKYGPAVFPAEQEGRDTQSLRNTAKRLDELISHTAVLEAGLSADLRRVLARLLSALEV